MDNSGIGVLIKLYYEVLSSQLFYFHRYNIILNYSYSTYNIDRIKNIDVEFLLEIKYYGIPWTKKCGCLEIIITNFDIYV